MSPPRVHARVAGGRARRCATIARRATVLSLPGVTLCCVDTANHALALRALAHSRRGVRFARTLLLTDACPRDRDAPGDRRRADRRIASRDAYSQFVLKHLAVTSTRRTCCSSSGTATSSIPRRGTTRFSTAITSARTGSGTPTGHDVGNGGFSLRSRRLLDALQDPRIELVEAEDVTICRTFRPLLEREHGIVFADEALADRFAFEAAYPIGRPFGFHGLFNFCRVVPPDEIAALAPTFSDAIARSPQLAQLLRNCIALGQWAPPSRSQRMLAASRRTPKRSGARAVREAALARGAGVGRNDPCPCGSGKRYKHCHGALGVGRAPAAAPPDALARARLDAHQRGDLDAAPSATIAPRSTPAPAHALALHYLGVIALPARPSRRRAAAARAARSRACPASPSSTTTSASRSRRPIATTRRSPRTGARSRSSPTTPARGTISVSRCRRRQRGRRRDRRVRPTRCELAPKFAQAHWNLALALLLAGDSPRAGASTRRASRSPSCARRPGRRGPRWDGGEPRRHDGAAHRRAGPGRRTAVRPLRAAARRARRAGDRAGAAPLAHVARARSPGVAASSRRASRCRRTTRSCRCCRFRGALGIDATRSRRACRTSRRRSRAPRRCATRSRRSGERLARRPRLGGQPAQRQRPPALAAARRARAAVRAAGHRLAFAAEGRRRRGDRAVPAASRLVRARRRGATSTTPRRSSPSSTSSSPSTRASPISPARSRGPVWILLPFAPDWRWQLGRDDSPGIRRRGCFANPRPAIGKRRARRPRAALAVRAGDALSASDAALRRSRGTGGERVDRRRIVEDARSACCSRADISSRKARSPASRDAIRT